MRRLQQFVLQQFRFRTHIQSRPYSIFVVAVADVLFALAWIHSTFCKRQEISGLDYRIFCPSFSSGPKHHPSKASLEGPRLLHTYINNKKPTTGAAAVGYSDCCAACAGGKYPPGARGGGAAYDSHFEEWQSAALASKQRLGRRLARSWWRRIIRRRRRWLGLWASKRRIRQWSRFRPL